MQKRLIFLLRLRTLLGAALVTFASAAATPGALPIELGWEGPASCPVSDDLQRDVRRYLGEAALGTTPPPIAARVSVRENAGRFDVRMLTTSGGETRERALSTATCAEAHDLVAFLLALLIDPNAHERTPAAAAPPPAAPPLVTPPPRPPARPPPADRSWFRRLAALSASGEYGTLPGGSLGGEARVGLLVSAWSLEARGAAWLPRRAESAVLPAARGKFTLLDAGLIACARGAPWGTPALELCAGPTLAFLRGEGYGVRAPGRDDALFLAASAETALLIAVSSRLSLRPGLGALVPFRRPTFAIHDVGRIHRPRAIAARALLGIEAQF